MLNKKIIANKIKHCNAAKNMVKNVLNITPWLIVLPLDDLRCRKVFKGDSSRLGRELAPLETSTNDEWTVGPSDGACEGRFVG